MPPSRELAVALNLSRDTVTNAYRELARLGYIGTDSTRRTYILSRHHVTRKSVQDELVHHKLTRDKLSTFGKQMNDEPASSSFVAKFLPLSILEQCPEVRCPCDVGVRSCRVCVFRETF